MKTFSILLALVVLLLPGCAKVKDRSALLRDIPTEQVRMEPRHTQVAGMTLRIPKGFVVEWTEEARYDKFYIYEPKDTGDVQQGMVTLDITPDPAKLIPDTAKYERSVGKMGEHEVQWRERTVTEPPAAKLFQREMVTRELFKDAEKYNRVEGLVLHAFVVGTDSLLVERLTATVETISLVPMKPNL